MVWDRALLRATMLTAVLAVQVALAIPSPNVSDSLLADPAAQLEVGRWQRALESVGVSTTNEQLMDWAQSWSARINTVRTTLLAPFRPLLRLIGTDQDWALFAYPQTHPFTIEVAARPAADAEWTVLYQPHDADRSFLSGTIEYRRFRGVMMPLRGRPTSWEGGVDFIARTVFQAYPDAAEVRVRAIRTRTTLPRETPDTDVEERFVETRHR